MKRLLIAVCLLLTPAAFAAVNVAPGDRVAVLRSAVPLDGTWLLDRIQRNLSFELRSLGIDAFDAGRTYADVVANGPVDAHYVLELRAANVRERITAVDDMALNGKTAVLVTKVETQVDLRILLYDATTFELLRTWELHENAGGAPALGQFWLAPFSRHSSRRAAARAVAREAALKVANINQIE